MAPLSVVVSAFYITTFYQINYLRLYFFKIGRLFTSDIGTHDLDACYVIFF